MQLNQKEEYKMKTLLKLFLSAILFPTAAFSAEFKEDPMKEPALAFSDESTCLTYLQNALQHCGDQSGIRDGRVNFLSSDWKPLHANMGLFYKECVIKNNYKMDSHSTLRLKAHTCWLQSVGPPNYKYQRDYQQYKERRIVIRSLIRRYFPEDLIDFYFSNDALEKR